jgi:hypothetical protein
LIGIESDAFRWPSFQSIDIPRHAEILGFSDFSGCESLSSISFESNSQLKQIEERTLIEFHDPLPTPSTILFIASNAAPRFFQIS